MINPYLSVAKLSFQAPRDAQKATLDTERMADLRKSHFKVGLMPQPMVS